MDFNEMMQSKICTFVLLNWPIILSELNVGLMIVMILTDVHI